MVTSRYFLDWDFDHFRSRWIVSDYIRSAPVTTDYQKIEIWKSKSKKNSKKIKIWVVYVHQRNWLLNKFKERFKNIFILNYINL